MVALSVAAWFAPSIPFFIDQRWFFAILTLVVAVWCWQSRNAGLRLDLAGFQVNNGWMTDNYAWTAVSEFKTRNLAFPLGFIWIEFRDRAQSDLESSHFIPLSVVGLSIEDVCGTLNAFRQRALEHAI